MFVEWAKTYIESEHKPHSGIFFIFLPKLQFWYAFHVLQEVNIECKGKYYNSVIESCRIKLAKVDEVRYIVLNLYKRI